MIVDVEKVQIDPQEMLTVTLSGADWAVLILGLSELKHGIAAPVDRRLVREILRAKCQNENQGGAIGVTAIQPDRLRVVDNCG